MTMKRCQVDQYYPQTVTNCFPNIYISDKIIQNSPVHQELNICLYEYISSALWMPGQTENHALGHANKTKAEGGKRLPRGQD